MDDRVLFLKEFLRNPSQVGSIIPSSRFLERRLLDLAEIRSAQTIIELGAGTGGTTRAILAAMPSDAKLLTIDINPRFCDFLRHIDDPRLIVHCGSAVELQELLARYGLSAPDAVLSGIPFSTIRRDIGSRIIETISSALAAGGRFVAYQVRSQVADISRPIMGPSQASVELLNIPPVRLYRWEKAAVGAPLVEHAAG